MKRLFLLQLIFVFAVITGTVMAQENAEWEPQTNVTGYLATQYEYFPELKYFDREYGIAVTEAGILASYKPLEKLEIKTVFVYRPNFTIEQMINEANAEYTFSDFFKVKAGRFLTPLSPMNTYYYSPVNNSATLPMIIANHEFFPLNIDAISLNGKIGEDLKIDYEGFFGAFRNALWLKTGALGLFGDENNYFQRVINLDSIGVNQSNANDKLHLGGGAHIGFSYKEFVTIGLNAFRSSEYVAGSIPDMMGGVYEFNSELKKKSYGINASFKYSTLKLIGEYWDTECEMDFLGSLLKLKYKGGFVELSNTFFNKLTPYVRYEYHEIPGNVGQIDYYRYTAGINYKPIFETTIKLEYLYYKYGSLDQNGLVATLIYSF